MIQGCGCRVWDLGRGAQALVEDFGFGPRV